MLELSSGERFLLFGGAARVDCPVCREAMAPAVVDGYGILLWWCNGCERAVDDETLRRELASRLSCVGKRRSGLS